LIKADYVKHRKYTRVYFERPETLPNDQDTPEKIETQNVEQKEVIDMIQAVPTNGQVIDDYWQQTLSALALQMTKSTFETWLKPTLLLHEDEETLVVGVTSEAAQAWLDNRLRMNVERAVAKVWGKTMVVVFEVQ
jgi:hypothetical protein